jgi:hypothetical protein
MLGVGGGVGVARGWTEVTGAAAVGGWAAATPTPAVAPCRTAAAPPETTVHTQS